VLPDTSGPFTYASGQWTVPTLNCAATPNGSSSVWVGVGGSYLPDGQPSGLLLQTGVTDQCANGIQSDVGWWELYPSTPNVAQNYEDFQVKAGDVMRAEITFDASNQTWETELDDVGTGLSGISVIGTGWAVYETSSLPTSPVPVGPAVQGVTTGLSYAGGTTAEWIVEDYQVNTTEVPFADFGTVNFTNLATSLAGASLSTDDGLYLDENQQVLAVPSAPFGNAFSITYGG